MVDFVCPFCDYRRVWSDGYQGHSWPCPNCKILVDVPIMATASPAFPSQPDGLRSTPHRKVQPIYLAAAAGVIVLLTVILLILASRSPSIDPAIGASFDPKEFCRIALADEWKARGFYKGKTVEITGDVYAAQWGPDKREGLFVILETRVKDMPFPLTVSAWFDPPDEKKVLALRKGQMVRMRGVIIGVVGDALRSQVSVELDGAELIEQK